MFLRTLLVAAATWAAGVAHAATCTSPGFSLGALPGDTPVTFSGTCTGGSGGHDDPDRSFVSYYTFTLTDPVSWLWGQLALHPVRDLHPDSPTRGSFLSGLSIDLISLIRGGIETAIGTGFGIARAERASFYAADLDPGDYTLAIYGSNIGLTQPGHYDATMGVSYVAHAPEPETYALMGLGLIAVAAVARRRRGSR
ncbi:FxDxF family PEP-CTERM protein [Caldimonas thermodepolymerans]|jgi:PEP-CTERM putative exosortase interaction domain|uniref:FxDxF family PEP-CTERM protein n=1 Tax=Caldimonas thermodepolymerans TaxID=215580 RepID=UPI0024936034|nr:FxDxF family PEP-CTERM protein [Caldimonas thermodepolymerans]